MNRRPRREHRLTRRGFSVPGKIFLSFGSLCAILLAIGGLFFFSLRGIERLNEAERQSTHEAIEVPYRLIRNAGLRETEIFQCIAAMNPVEREEHEEVLARLEKSGTGGLQAYAGIADNEVERDLFAEVLRTSRAYTEKSDELLALNRTPRKAEAAIFALTTQIATYDRYQKALDAILRHEVAEGYETARFTTERIARSRVAGDILIVLAVVVVLGTAVAVLRVVRRLREDKIRLQTEVDEHEKAQQALREGEARYRLLVDHSPDGILVICENKIVFANPAIVRLLGADQPGQLIGLSTSALVHPDEHGQIAERTMEVAADGQPPVVERRMLRLDGSILEVESSIISFLYEGKRAEQVILRDNTERKSAAEKLNAQANQYRLLFEDNPSPMWVFDVQSLNFLAVNQAAISSYGYSREEFLARTLRDIRPAEDVAALVSAVSSPSAPAGFGGEWRHLKKDGSIITAAIYSSPTIFDNKKARMVLAVDRTKSAEAERKVRVSEANLALAQQVAGVGSWEYEFTADGQVDEGKLICSREAYRLFGRSSDETHLSIESFYGALHPDDRAFIAAGFLALKERNQPFDYDYRIIRPDGTERIIHSVAETIFDPHTNKRSKVIGTLLDITERRAVEKQLREADEKYRLIFDNALEGIFQSTPDGLFISTNPAFARMLGYASPEELIRERKDITRQSYAEPVKRQEFKRLLEKNGVVSDFEFEVKRKDGSTIWMSENVRVVRDPAGKAAYYEGTAQDITARKETEDRLREQARLIDLAQDAIMVRDMDDRIEFWSHGAEGLYGWTAEEAVGQLTGDLLDYPEAEKILAERIVLETGAWSGECRHLTKAGHIVIVRCRWTLVRDELGRPKSKLVIATDITEQKKIEEQFLRTQRLESIGTLASGVAHDLNNILLPIMMAAPILREEIDPIEREKFLDIVEGSAKRGANIIKQVLTFARGADGDHILLQPIYLLEEVASIAGQTFPKSIALRTSYDEHIRSLEADPTQLHQVLLNLCINARDAMPNGGQLCLGAENFDVDEHYASMTPGATVGPHVMLQVTDTGTGIPKDVIDKIFDPFFTTKNIGEGTGLGLSTVAGIVKSHGGFINLESKPGHTSFKIFLPAQETLDTVGALPAESILPRGDGQIILVVDDEPSIREVAQLILESYGYKVLVAEDGPEALALFAQQAGKVAAVVTDLAMPLMSGLMLVRALRRIEPGLKIIVSTGRNDDSQEEQMAALKVAGYLMKPFTTRNLLFKLNHVLHPGLQDAA